MLTPVALGIFYGLLELMSYLASENSEWILDRRRQWKRSRQPIGVCHIEYKQNRSHRL